MADNIERLVQGMISGDRKALARLITRVENRDPRIAQALAQLLDRVGRAYIIGVTGPPGAGKSSLADKLIARFRKDGKSVGVVAIDPSSPFSGGALLGDRLRMGQHALDKDVFIRSLGSRGSRGGLSLATFEVVALMDAFGLDVVLVETVGVGQTELDIMELAHSVVVVFVPESGDVVQTMKAGLTEIADVFVVNKSDRPGADVLVRELNSMIDYAHASQWRIPVVRTVAINGEGVEELFERLVAHRDHQAATGKDAVAMGHMRLARFAEVLTRLLNDRLAALKDRDGDLGAIAGRVRSGEINPYAAAGRVMSDPKLILELLGGGKGEG